MSLTDDYKSIVKRLRGWGFQVREESGCYGANNGAVYNSGRPDGHINHHFVCSLNPSQSYIDGLVSMLVNGYDSTPGPVVNWFADMNGHIYFIASGCANHAGTGNSSVLSRTKNNQAPSGPAGASGDMNGNENYAGTETQHPGDATPYPQPLLEATFAINAAEFVQWNYSENRAIHHYEWTNRKNDMSWEGGPSSTKGGVDLRAGVKKYMSGGGSGGGGDWFDMASLDDLKNAVRAVLQETDLVTYTATDQGNGATSSRKVSVVKGIGDATTYAGRAARAAQQAI